MTTELREPPNPSPRARARRARALAIALWLWTVGTPAWSDEASVRAVLFHSPTCSHCEEVIRDHLPSLSRRFGKRLELAMIDTQAPEGRELFGAALRHFEVPAGRRGVPMLILGETVLVGSDEIPRELPALVESGLARGGLDWPEIPGLAERLASARGAPPGGLDLRRNLARDPLGNALAIAVLVGMLGVGAWVLVSWRQPAAGFAAERRERAIPVLAVAGLAIAAYLTIVEVTQTRAFCGPVGDCNAVQQSSWARLFGLVPVGLLGLAGYVAILAASVVGRRARAPLRDWADAALLALAALGTLFSIYLTFLEPFVIGAVCAWCLASAVLMAALLWASAAPGRRALERLRAGTGAPSRDRS